MTDIINSGKIAGTSATQRCLLKEAKYETEIG